MMKQLRFSNVWLFITLALAVAFGGQPAAAYQLEVSAWIDGHSQLLIQGSTVQWHNFSWYVPGLQGGHNYPTYLTTVDLGAYAWYPGWPGATSNRWSSQFTVLDKPLSTTVDQTVGFTIVTAREHASIFQQPSVTNGYQLIVDFNDDVTGAAAWYTVKLDYTTVPLPGTLALLGPGLVGLMVWGRRRQASKG